MAQASLSIGLETDLMDDLVQDMLRIAQALPRRHGPEFRALDRRFAALNDGEADMGAPDLKQLEPGLFVVTPPAELAKLIAEARRLGVI